MTQREFGPPWDGRPVRRPPSKGGCDLPAPHGWKRERQRRRIGHGGRGSRDRVTDVGISTQSLSHINVLPCARHPYSTALE